MKAPDIIVEEFEETAEARGDDPDDALERLLLEYIREDSTIAELFSDDGEPVTSLDDYNAGDDRPLGYDAAEALPSYAGIIEIDPDDVIDEELPQYRDVKREIIFSVLRYRRKRNDKSDDGRRHETVVRRNDVVTAAEAVVDDLDNDYKKDEYVEQVIDEWLIRNPWDEQMAFFSESDAMEYLKSLEPGGHKEENDVYYLSNRLVQQYSDNVDVKALNEVRRRFSFEPVE